MKKYREYGKINPYFPAFLRLGMDIIENIHQESPKDAERSFKASRKLLVENCWI